MTTAIFLIALAWSALALIAAIADHPPPIPGRRRHLPLERAAHTTPARHVTVVEQIRPYDWQKDGTA